MARRAPAQAVPFDKRLALSAWLLSLFEVKDFETLAGWLSDPDLEGLDEENVSRFHRQLALRLIQPKHLHPDQLLEYDTNIVRHWKQITARRGAGQTLHMKYFQYLALLFTEIYLDRWFRDADRLLTDLNAYLPTFNMTLPEHAQVPAFAAADLNKLAFWMATGSGKTLLMHCHILQFQHYLAAHGSARSLNRVILLTPNEGLSRQHLAEFELSSMQAELFQREGRGLFAGHAVEIIDINKLREDQGQKTVAVDAFEDNNLVLVDEGHRGAGGDVWMDLRRRMCEKGFSFEYSATFGQAMKAANKKALADEYARCILFDYSYRYFYKDGYGKDYRIFNLANDGDEDVRRRYLTACLLTYYQQALLFADRREKFGRFLLDAPLWVFVGARVNAVRTESKHQVSDVVDILLFLRDFIANGKQSADDIKRIIDGKGALLNAQGSDIFASSFPYLVAADLSGEAMLNDIMATVFNCSTPGALHVEDLKGADGEIALRVGDNEPFGVINVGDTSNLMKLCEAQGLTTSDREFSGSLFQKLNDPSSRIRLLIGSKKFTEGWSSWRVATMGLMHVGKSEGSEIIQLFGRGVRLKGYEWALKRSGYVTGIERPQYIGLLETLNVLGVRADYMAHFRQYLEDEGLSPDKEFEEFVLATVPLAGLDEKKLRIVRLKDGIDFKRAGPKPRLDVHEDIARHPIVVDWYPRIQSRVAVGLVAAGEVKASKNSARLTSAHLAFMNFDEIWFELHRLKNERAWYNFDLPREAPRALLEAGDWYTLYIPPEEMRFADFGRVRRWQEIAIALLSKYCDRYYKTRKAEFEDKHLEYRELTKGDANFVEQYEVAVERSQHQVAEVIRQIKQELDAGNLAGAAKPSGNFASILFDRHLYNPLLYCKGGYIEIKPVALNDGEREFVLGLKSYYESDKSFFKDRELYLLRNKSKSGLGFFEAGNFYPDFIVWLVTPERQYVTFVDPKGIRNLAGIADPKIRFSEKIKELEKRLGDPSVTLNSFILSVTPHKDVTWAIGSVSPSEFAARNVLFMPDMTPLGVSKALLAKVVE